MNRLHGSANAFLIAALSEQLGRPLVVLSPTEKEARETFQDLSLFLGSGKVLLYPPWDIQTTDMFALQRDVELVRMEVLARLLTDEPAVIVASLKALRTYVESLDADAFDEVIGEFAGKPETRQDRLSLILIDAVQHIAQAQYVAGMTEVRA